MPAPELRDAFRQDARAIDDLLEQVRALARGDAAAARPDPRLVAELTRDAIVQFTGPGFGFRLIVPGSHYSGLSNQALLEVRAREGRDFDANTVQLKQWLRRELLARFRGFGRVPTLAEITDLASRLVVNYVATVRVLGGGGDILETPLTAKYEAWKRARGKGGKPIGVFNGRWLAALIRQGRADFTHV